jgi:hypothetical protein
MKVLNPGPFAGGDTPMNYIFVIRVPRLGRVARIQTAERWSQVTEAVPMA